MRQGRSRLHPSRVVKARKLQLGGWYDVSVEAEAGDDRRFAPVGLAIVFGRQAPNGVRISPNSGLVI